MAGHTDLFLFCIKVYIYLRVCIIESFLIRRIAPTCINCPLCTINMHHNMVISNLLHYYRWQIILIVTQVHPIPDFLTIICPVVTRCGITPRVTRCYPAINRAFFPSFVFLFIFHNILF